MSQLNVQKIIILHNFISGHKSSPLSSAGILLTLSLFFSLCTYIGVVCFLGHASIFLVPAPLAVLAIVLLIAKSMVDADFREQPIGQKITYALLAAIFPVSSSRPKPHEDVTTDAVIVKGDKNSTSELTLLHFLHLLTYLAGALTYFLLSESNPAFNETMRKIEISSGINSSWVIFVLCPLACILSIITRLLFNRVEPWSTVHGPLDRGCCSWWPPKLKSTYKDTELNIEEPRVADNPTAEVAEMIDYIAENRQLV